VKKEKELNLLFAKNWKFQSQKQTLEKTFVLKSFLEAIELINKIAPEAEKLKHHPDLTLVYNKLEIRLTTHDQNQVTDKDFELARIIDGLANNQKTQV